MPSEDDEIFEINDFTVVSELERFVVSVESALHEWNLNTLPPRQWAKGSLSHMTWSVDRKLVKFGEHNNLHLDLWTPDIENTDDVVVSERDLHLTASQLEMTCPETDFATESNITTMFGITSFVVVSPVDARHDCISSEDEKNLILSALRIATQSSECDVPVVLQYGDEERQLFMGVSWGRASCTHFEGAHLRACQPRHQHLSGLLHMFKEKVASPLSSLDLPEVRISLQFEYQLESGVDLPSRSVGDGLDPIDCTRFPLGSIHEPLHEMRLIGCWSNLKEDVVQETEDYSDLDPSAAPRWAASVEWRHDSTTTLGSILDRMRSLTKGEYADDKLRDVLGSPASAGQRAFDSLADPRPLSQLRIGAPPTSITNPMPILPDDADEATFDEVLNAVFAEPSEKTEYHEGLSSCKASPRSSLLSRIATAIAYTLPEESDSNRPLDFARLWLQFVRRLRRCYENNHNLPGLSSCRQPTLSACLLEQKLEMLQCCISARRRRHQLYDQATEFAADNDEFFDAEEDVEEGGATAAGEEGSSRSTSHAEGAELEPCGREHPLGELRLLHHPSQPLWVPITQEGSPMTEDMVEEHARYISSLRDGQERMEAQLDTLRSDMQAFKAANPLCCLEDFIRWHSPKDWMEEEGRLSERMLLPDNTWQRCWLESAPLPVIKQNKIFNEAKIGEEILLMLENVTASRLVHLLQPVVVVHAANALHRIGAACCEERKWQELLTAVAKATRFGGDAAWNEAQSVLSWVDARVCQFRALQSRLGEEDEVVAFILGLIDEAETNRFALAVTCRGVCVPGASRGKVATALKGLLDDGKWPTVSRRQYVLRWRVPRHSVHSRPTPQRMFASIERDEFRCCIATTDDVIFS